MAFHHAEQVHFHVPHADGGAPALVVHAYRTGETIYPPPSPSPRRERTKPAWAVLMGCLLAVGLAGNGAVLGSETTDRWVAVACLVLGAAIGVVLGRSRLRRRPEQPPSEQELRQAASSLARTLTEQYARDQAAVRIDDPGPLPVRWAEAPSGLGDHAVNFAGAGEAVPRLDGSFSHIVRTYESLPHGRLVILGEAGAGKSVLVLHLAAGLLARRKPGDPVPVVFPVSSWDPGEGTPLWWWAAGWLAQTHAWVLADDGFPGSARAIAHGLITSGRVLPVLDGFDELPDATRSKALAQLCRSLLPSGRFVLTSRTAEFTEAVNAGELRIPKAAAVQLQPLEPDELRAYLPRTSRERDDSTTKWDRVLERIAAVDAFPAPESSARACGARASSALDSGARPSGAPDFSAPDSGARDSAAPDSCDSAARRLREVLRTPLMVSLARAVYSDTTAHPDELLEQSDLTTREAVERHLLSAFVDTAYQPDPAAVPGRHDRVTPGRARGYLVRLARGTGQDIAWWRLEEQVPWTFRALLVSLPLGLLLAAAVAATALPAPGESAVPGLGLRAGLLTLVAALCAGTLDWIGEHGTVARPPHRLHSPRREVRDSLRRRPVGAVLSAVVPVAGLAVWIWAVASGNGVAVFFASFLLFAPLAAVSRALAVVRRPADLQASDPVTLLREDRRTTLALAPFTSPHTRSMLSVQKALPVLVIPTLLFWGLGRGADAVTPWRWVAVFGALAGWWCLWSCAMSAWGRFTLARWWLASTGRLPRQLTDFLADAHRRGVLRQTGGLYRFRHIELQRSLAAEPEPRDAAGRTGRARRLGIGALSAAMGATTAVLLVGSVFSAPGAMGPLRMLAPACELLPLSSVRPLMGHPGRGFGGQQPVDIFSDARHFLDDGFRQPKRADDRHARARSSCVTTEQSALRPDTQVVLTVALAAGAGMTDSAERAQYEVEHPGLLDARVRSSGTGWSVAAGTEWASSPDPRSRRADEDIPVGWARGRVGNALVAVDVALEFGTERQAREAAETLVRQVLDRIRLTYGLQAGPVPEGRPLTRVPESGISDASRFGVFDRKRTGRLGGAAWEEADPARVVALDELVGLRVPREARCSTGEGEGEGEGDGDGDGGQETGTGTGDVTGRWLACTVSRGPAAGFRMDVVFAGCGASCSASERRAFTDRRPGRTVADWDHHGTVAHDRSPGSGYLYRTLKATYHQGRNEAVPLEVLLWLHVSSPTYPDLADKILNDVWSQTEAGR
ncbi:NACHT domain-containing protein [Streptomyces sp. NPDC088707]|uniref:NACHT domain-containing protein n=1 Tax=Streptomyces sp. NPDC088707 TaxID=3365871 RepID=UPI0037FEC663